MTKQITLVCTNCTANITTIDLDQNEDALEPFDINNSHHWAILENAIHDEIAECQRDYDNNPQSTISRDQYVANELKLDAYFFIKCANCDQYFFMTIVLD